MQKIVLSQATLGLLIGRLKNFFAGDVIENEYDDTLSPAKVAKLPFNFTADSWSIAMVTRHWMMNDTLRVRKGRPRPMIHVSHSEDCATFFKEGDEFYFFGNRNIVVRRVNSSTKWDEAGENIPTISRFMLNRSRHKLYSYELGIKNDHLEAIHQMNEAVYGDTMRLDMEAEFGEGRYAHKGQRDQDQIGDFMTADDLG